MTNSKLTIQEAVKTFIVSEKTIRRNIKKGRYGYKNDQSGKYYIDQAVLTQIYKKRENDQGVTSHNLTTCDMVKLEKENKALNDRLGKVLLDFANGQKLLTASKDEIGKIKNENLENLLEHEKKLRAYDAKISFWKLSFFVAFFCGLILFISLLLKLLGLLPGLTFV